MKYVIMHLVMVYIVACADYVDDPPLSVNQRILRAFLWPITLTGWFTTHSIKLHRTLTILWIFLIAGWLLSLVADRVP